MYYKKVPKSQWHSSASFFLRTANVVSQVQWGAAEATKINTWVKLGSPAQWHARRKELRHYPGRATRLLTAKAVICAVSEQVFVPRLADTEPRSAGLSTRASRAWEVIWKATCHLLAICKPAAPRTQSMESSLCPVFGTDSTCSCPLQEQTEEASQQAFQDYKHGQHISFSTGNWVFFFFGGGEWQQMKMRMKKSSHEWFPLLAFSISPYKWKH